MKINTDPAVKLELVGEISVSYLPSKRMGELPQITTSGEAYPLLREWWDDDEINHREKAIVMVMSVTNRILGYFVVSSGGVAGTIIDPKLIMQVALAANASHIILAHNHPSESMKPSVDDIRVTTKLYEACQLMDIKLLDHLIMGYDTYYSFKEAKLLL